jgi:hypothetical protein
MNIFKKISKKTIGWFGSSMIPAKNSNKFLLSWFGNSSVVWSKYIPQTQNSILLIEKFNELAELSAPIYKFSDSSSQVTIDTFRKAGNDLVLVDEFDPVKKQIDKFWNNFAGLLLIHKKLLGNVYINFFDYKNYLTGENEKEIKLLPPQYTFIVPENLKNIDIRTQRAKGYIVDIDSNHSILNIDAKDVLHIKDSNPTAEYNNYLYGISKLVSNGKNIDCLSDGYGAKKTLYTSGPKGFVTGKSAGNEFMATNIETDESTIDLQDRFNQRYGLQENQYQWLVTTRPMDVKVTSFNVNDLQLNEMNRTDFEKICATLNINPLAVCSTYGNTFDNVKAAITEFYTGAFKLEVDSILKLINQKINEWYPDYVLQPNYTRIPEIVDALKEGDAEMLELTLKGLFSRNEYFKAIGERTVDLPEFDEFYYFNNGWYPLGYVAPNNTDYEQE